MSRYIKQNAYYRSIGNIWLYSEVLYDTHLKMYVNPDGSLCDRIYESIPYGEITFNSNKLVDEENNNEFKSRNEKPIVLPERVLENINSEHQFYETELETFLNEKR